MIAWDGIERRRFIRVKLHCKTSISDQEGLTISTYAEEISEKGLKVSIKQELKRSSLVDLEIYLRPQPIVCKGKIVWVRKIESDYLEGGVVYDIGIELRNLKEDDKKLIKQLIIQKKQQKGFLSILGLLITVVIIAFLSYLLINVYLFRQPAILEMEQGVPQNVHGVKQYQTIIDDTHRFTAEINEGIRSRQQQIDDMLP